MRLIPGQSVIPRLRRIIGRPGCDVVLADTYGDRCGDTTAARDKRGWHYCARHADEFGIEVPGAT